jgi:hypothetical protein
MAHNTPQPNGSYCLTGDRCRDYNHVAKHPAELAPQASLCDACLDVAERDVRCLVFDYLDLAQLQLPVLSQALDTQPAGSAGPPMPMAGAPEALQAEIVHVLTTWEIEVRAATSLSAVPESRRRTAAPWHTTVTNRQPLVPVHPGAAVQRAVEVLAPRMRLLSELPPVAVFRTGCEDDSEDVAGWEAVLHLSRLHQRARATLGRTRRTFWVPGDCWQQACCDTHTQAVARGRLAGEFLYRSEPARYGDEPQIFCRYCEEPRSYEEYQRYLHMLVWPQRETQPARTAA